MEQKSNKNSQTLAELSIDEWVGGQACDAIVGEARVGGTEVCEVTAIWEVCDLVVVEVTVNNIRQGNEKTSVRNSCPSACQ